MERPAAEHPSAHDLIAFTSGQFDQIPVKWVSQHLGSCAVCQTAVQRISQIGAASAVHGTTPTRGSETAADTPPPPDINPDDIPASLRDHEKYRIIRELGRGGMGVVYQAEHKIMGRLVAVKVINRALLDHPNVAQRFEREIKAAASLDHPNVAKAFDAERAGDLQLLVMEFVSGESLADHMTRKGPLPVAHACYYIRQAALGLQHAHEKGLVHRDLKPQNLMRIPKGIVKILDFGLAKLVSEHMTVDGLTADGTAIGTPQYMSPEQWRSSKAADIRADIYSLGCSLFCLLTGRPPFIDRNQIGYMAAHAMEAPPPVESLRPDVPPELSSLVVRMLAKEPAQRPQTPKEVAAELVPFIKSNATRSVTPTAPPSKTDPSQSQVRIAKASTTAERTPHRLLPAMVTAGVLLGIILAGFALTAKILQRGTADGQTPSGNTATGMETETKNEALPSVAKSDQPRNKAPIPDLSASPPPSPIGIQPLEKISQPTNPKRQLELKGGWGRLKGHKGGAGSVAFSPNGKWLASSDRDLAIRLWNTDTWTQVEVIRGRAGHFFFSKDSRLLASALSDGTVRVISLESLDELAQIDREDKDERHPKWPAAISFSSDQRRILAVVDDQLLEWTIETRKLIREVWLGKKVSYAAFSPDGRRLLGSGLEERVDVWDVETGKRTKSFGGLAGWVHCLAFSGDGRYATCGTLRGEIRVWDLEKGELHTSLTDPTCNPVDKVALVPGGRHLVSGTGGSHETRFSGSIRLWSLESGKEVACVPDELTRGWIAIVQSLACSPDGRWVAVTVSGQNDKDVWVWQLPK